MRVFVVGHFLDSCPSPPQTNEAVFTHTTIIRTQPTYSARTLVPKETILYLVFEGTFSMKGGPFLIGASFTENEMETVNLPL